MTIRSIIAPLLGLALLVATHATLATPPAAFTAKYKVLRDGSPMGEATITLHAGSNGQWVYNRDIEGTAGMAAMLGASTRETSRFRWKDGIPEAISYDYVLNAAFKTKRRHLTVDWPAQKVSVDDGKDTQTYPSQAGMVERNTTALAVGVALRDGQQQIDLPVAVKQRVETQSFKVTGQQTVQVPAGSFQTIRVERTDTDRGFDAWYAPDQYPMPVKITQKDDGDLTMELVSYSTP